MQDYLENYHELCNVMSSCMDRHCVLMWYDQNDNIELKSIVICNIWACHRENYINCLLFIPFESRFSKSIIFFVDIVVFKTSFMLNIFLVVAYSCKQISLGQPMEQCPPRGTVRFGE